MANIQIGTQEFCIPDKRRTAVAVLASTNSLTTPLNMDSISALRTRLAAIDATFYSSARLDAMTLNDMQYAVRTADELASI